MAKKKKKAKRKRVKRPSKAKPENAKNRLGLNPKQKRFCEEYVIDLDPGPAYVRAGYSKKGAPQAAHKLLKHADVQRQLAKLTEKRSKAVGITAERVLEELAILGFSDINDYKNTKEGFYLSDKTNDAASRAVSSIKLKRHTGKDGVEVTTEIRLWDKPASLRLLAQHLGMLNDRGPIPPGGGVTVQVAIFPSNGREVEEDTE